MLERTRWMKLYFIPEKTFSYRIRKKYSALKFENLEFCSTRINPTVHHCLTRLKMVEICKGFVLIEGSLMLLECTAPEHF